MGDTRKRLSNSQAKFKHPLQHENRPDADTEYSYVTSLFCQIYSIYVSNQQCRLVNSEFSSY